MTDCLLCGDPATHRIRIVGIAGSVEDEMCLRCADSTGAYAITESDVEQVIVSPIKEES